MSAFYSADFFFDSFPSKAWSSSCFLSRRSATLTRFTRSKFCTTAEHNKTAPVPTKSDASVVGIGSAFGIASRTETNKIALAATRMNRCSSVKFCNARKAGFQNSTINTQAKLTPTHSAWCWKRPPTNPQVAIRASSTATILPTNALLELLFAK